jgi:hypothetical protein
MFHAASDSLQPDEYIEDYIAAIRHNQKIYGYTQLIKQIEAGLPYSWAQGSLRLDSQQSDS